MPVTFARSTDYAAIRELLTDPTCFRRMGHTAPELDAFEVGPRAGIEYVTANEKGSLLAVFLIVELAFTAAEVHFCFSRDAWGHTQAIARGFLGWAWANTPYTRLRGPVPLHNRLALKLALAVGFSEYGTTAELALLDIRKPHATL